MPLSYGDVIRVVRRAAGHSLIEAGELTGVDMTMFSRVERGEVMPAVAFLARMSGAYGVDVPTLAAMFDNLSPLWDHLESHFRRTTTNPTSADVLELMRKYTSHDGPVILSLPDDEPGDNTR